MSRCRRPVALPPGSRQSPTGSRRRRRCPRRARQESGTTCFDRSADAVEIARCHRRYRGRPVVCLPHRRSENVGLSDFVADQVSATRRANHGIGDPGVCDQNVLDVARKVDHHRFADAERDRARSGSRWRRPRWFGSGDRGPVPPRPRCGAAMLRTDRALELAARAARAAARIGCPLSHLEVPPARSMCRRLGAHTENALC